jgi:DedD protein
VERIVKERLVGAAVLMAAAINPDPGDAVGSGPRLACGGRPLSRATTVLSRRTRSTSVTRRARSPRRLSLRIAHRRPRSRPPRSPAASRRRSHNPAASDQAKPDVPQQPVATAPPPEPVRSEPAKPVVEPPTSTPAPARAAASPLASSAGAPTSGGWAVQVGSFSKEATAERVAKQLRDQGQSAFVMPVKSGGATLYRVRIGPNEGSRECRSGAAHCQVGGRDDRRASVTTELVRA